MFFCDQRLTEGPDEFQLIRVELAGGIEDLQE